MERALGLTSKAFFTVEQAERAGPHTAASLPGTSGPTTESQGPLICCHVKWESVYVFLKVFLRVDSQYMKQTL